MRHMGACQESRSLCLSYTIAVSRDFLRTRVGCLCVSVHGGWLPGALLWLQGLQIQPFRSAAGARGTLVAGAVHAPLLCACGGQVGAQHASARQLVTQRIVVVFPYKQTHGYLFSLYTIFMPASGSASDE